MGWFRPRKVDERTCDHTRVVDELLTTFRCSLRVHHGGDMHVDVNEEASWPTAERLTAIVRGLTEPVKEET